MQLRNNRKGFVKEKEDDLMHFPTAYFALKFKVIMVFATSKHAANTFPNIWNASLITPTSVTS